MGDESSATPGRRLPPLRTARVVADSLKVDFRGLVGVAPDPRLHVRYSIHTRGQEPSLVGKSLGHYEIAGPLGAGGMGEVYRARDTKLDRDVAMKLLPAAFADDPERLARFEREAKAVAALDHPNIVTVFSVEEAAAEDGSRLHFITMQLVDGSPLSRLIPPAGLPLKQFFEVAIPLADALSAAQEQGVIHRDLKPANVMVSRDGRVRVLDFGLAKLREPHGSERTTELATAADPAAGPLTDEGRILGTVPYMSPEQAEGKRVDHRSDIFSLGIILFEMSTGERPFKGDTRISIITSIMRDTPASVVEINEALPNHLGRIIKHCLEKDPERRLQSAKDLRNELQDLRKELESGEASAISGRGPAAAGDEGSAAPPVAAHDRAFVGRRWIVAATVLAALAVAVVYLAWQRSEESRRIESVIAELTPLVDAGRLDDIFTELQVAGVDLGDPRASWLADRVAGSVSISSEPTGATVSLTRVRPVSGFADRVPIVLRAPVEGQRLVAGEYFVGLTHEDGGSLEFLLDVSVGGDLRASRKLVGTSTDDEGMVRVEEGVSPVGDRREVVPAFLIDRYEVTNAQYLEFVVAGGYRDPALWPPMLILAGVETRWDSAVRTFTDRTDLPGPRGWRDGRFPDGTGDHPVTGVSWYEAAAFARWQGKELPTRDQWWLAALGAQGSGLPWGDDLRTFDVRANFETSGTDPVGAHPLGVSRSGCFDLAGNVREWLRDVHDDGISRSAVGGSWRDPTYTFDPIFREYLEPNYASDAIGFRLVKAVPGG